MKILLRGGQTTIHSIRMLKQVIWSLVKISLLIVVLTTLIKTFNIIDLYHIKIIILHYYGIFLTEIGNGSNIISFLNNSGYKVRLTALEIASNPLMLESKANSYQVIKNSFRSSILIAIISSLFLIIFFMIRGILMAKKKNISGNKLVSANYLTKLSLLDNYLRANFSALKLGKIPYPYNASKTHTIITGASGTGKTVLMTDLVNQIRKKHKKTIIYDKMGVYTKLFYDPNKGDILLNPLDERSPYWNIIEEGVDISDYETIAKAFIPEKTSNSDPYWENAARIVFAESMKYLKRMRMNNNGSLKEVFFSEDEELFNKIIKSSGLLKKILPEESERTTGSILSVMASYVSSLQYLDDECATNKVPFSIRKWVEDDKASGFLIIPSKANQHESLKPLISAGLEIAINSLLSLRQNNNREIYILLDELPSLHYLPSLQTGLSESRQFGGNFIISLQLMSQLKSVYGIDRATSISGLCRNRVVFSTPDEDTARWCSSTLGKSEVEEIREGFSYGSSEIRDGININKNIQIKPIVSATDIMDLENLNFYLKFSNNFPLTRQKLAIKNYKTISQSFIPARDSANNNLILEGSKEPQPKQVKSTKKKIVKEQDNQPEEDWVEIEEKPQIIIQKNNLINNE